MKRKRMKGSYEPRRTARLDPVVAWLRKKGPRRKARPLGCGCGGCATMLVAVAAPVVFAVLTAALVVAQ